MPSVTISTLSLPTFTGPLRETVLAGVNMPFANLAVGGAGDVAVTIVVSVGTGKLYADPAFGATVSGGGSRSLWIAGTAAQVSAKLATLVYTAGPAGDDALSISLLDQAGGVATLASIPIAVLPFGNGANAGGADPIIVAGGTLTLDTRTLDGVTLALSQPGGGLPPASLVLVNTTLGAGSALEIGNAAATATSGPRVATAGQVELTGSVTFGAGPALTSLALGAVVTNGGAIRFIDSSAVVSGGGTLRNDGTISVSGGAPSLDAAITGTGSITLAPGSTLTLSASIGSGQTIRFSGADTLVLGAAGGMGGTLAGLETGDAIVLTGVTADATVYRQTDATHGVLTVYDGSAVVTTLNMVGAAQGSFVLSSATVAGSVQLGLSAPPVQAGARATAATLDVYRFFDTTHGTEFLTQNPGERDAIAISRPDLVYEGVAMHAVDPSAPGAKAVFRFFDSVHGTHFFTASETERDTLLSTRPDLVFEPGSTLYEHATQQAGDVPVFRFFDTGAGTHFYTADAGERAQILATRTDLTPEGIAFYAPSR